MKDEYIIINRTVLEKRIKELETIEAELISKRMSYSSTRAKIDELISLLSQSIPLIPEIEKAIQFGKDIQRENTFLNNFDGVSYIDYHDTTTETYEYISNLKLDI